MNDHQARQAQRQALIRFRKQLPIWEHRKRLVEAVREHRNVCICSSTGSGKSTQVAGFLLDTPGLVPQGKMIAISQPRRVAAISVAKRVAEERGVVIGSQVGFAVRFDECWGKKTRIKFATDGMLVREMLQDPLFSKYSIVIIDEAHERSLQTDVLQALLKHAQTKRQDLKVIAMSATLDAEKFSKYWDSCPVLDVPGRLFPVQVLYTKLPQTDYMESTLISILQIHLNNSLDGDVLVFLTGQDDIESMEHLLKDKESQFPEGTPSLAVRPIYAALPPAQQMKVFEPTPENHRKIVLATNIAETSITIENIKYVVDCGFVKKRHFQPQTGLDSLLPCPVSKAEAWQRSGRAGRQKAGVCYRLYTEKTFDTLADMSTPEILRCNLASVVLHLKMLGIENMLDFQFMDMPDEESLIRALMLLFELGALNKSGELTQLGRQMVQFPLDPCFSRVVMASQEQKCTAEILTIVAMMSTDSIFYCPRSKREEANAARLRLAADKGDHLTLLKVYQACEAANFERTWCHHNFINHRAMMKARSIREQLVRFATQLDLKLESIADGTDGSDAIRRSLVVGLFLNTARLQADGSYTSIVDGKDRLYIHPTSTLFGRPKAPYILFTSKVQTSKQYMRLVSEIDAQWLPELAPRLYNRLAQNPAVMNNANQ